MCDFWSYFEMVKIEVGQEVFEFFLFIPSDFQVFFLLVRSFRNLFEILKILGSTLFFLEKQAMLNSNFDVLKFIPSSSICRFMAFRTSKTFFF